MFSSANNDNEESGEAVESAELIAQYQTVRIRALWTSYKRIFQLTKDSVRTLDPSAFRVTNKFPYGAIGKIAPDEKLPDQFSLEFEKTTFVYQTSHRPQLLCQLYECIYKSSKLKKSVGPLAAQRVRKNGSRIDCKIAATPYGILELDVAERLLQEYRWVNIKKFGLDEKSFNSLVFEHSGRIKIFILHDLQNFISGCKSMLRSLGLENIEFATNISMTTAMQDRTNYYCNTGSAVAVYSVNKVTRRSLRPMPRQLHVACDFLIEKDSSGFQYISCQKISSVYALIRSWSNQRELSIEYDDGTSRTYTCALRDTLLATLLDICHAASNLRVIVTGEVSDCLRLMPRFAEEAYKSSIKDAFFGASSIEAWYLSKLSKVCKNIPLLEDDVIEACKELNSNVPCPGISPNSDPALVKTSMTGLLKLLNTFVVNSISDERADFSRSMAIILQSLYRIIPSIHGFKGFVEIREVDSRLLLLQLLRFDKDFVNYWTLEVLMVLCRCPIMPRNSQQEFVNKHTLLSDKMLSFLIDLMSEKEEEEFPDGVVVEQSEPGVETITSPIISPNPAHTTAESSSEGVFSDPSRSNGMLQSNSNEAGPISPAIAPNPSNLSHLPSSSDSDASLKISTASPKRPTQNQGSERVMTFTPNSLVIVGAAALLESVVCSKRDTSSPELLNKVLDLLSNRYEVLAHMLRSNAFIIIENAAILMFVLLKNRPSVASPFRELALSDSLVLKHFYHAVFSNSVAQRFISRFLVATWMAGPAQNNPAKSLLTRIIPSGLVEYLKHISITEEHRKNLDELEEEFYTSYGGGFSKRTSSVSLPKTNEFHIRMRKKISAVLKESIIDRPVNKVPLNMQMQREHETPSTNFVPAPLPTIAVSSATTAHSQHGASTGPENYRIMFHVMTQDHKLPDLIWNEQTRLELRNTLNAELVEFEREQRLRGLGKIAWNYQQFFVKYESIGEELQVGPIYIHYFLEAGDSFVRALQNPSHVVLFEKLFRRVLVNVERNSSLSILCTRCLCRLYSVCKDIIGAFDDMLLTIRMLEQASNLELQHCIIDLLELLSGEDANLVQLLDREVVNSIIKYASLAHLNPDQIGNVLARATSNTLMIKDSSVSVPYSKFQEYRDDATSNALADFDKATSEISDITEEEKVEKRKRYLWVPDDNACPRVWFVAPKGPINPPPSNLHRGAFRVTELVDMLDRGQIDNTWLAAPSIFDDDSDRFQAVVDTGRWKPLSSYFQLRMQMIFPGKAVYSPAEVAAKALGMLSKISSVHKSANSRGVAFYPIPTSKKIMSEPDHLSVFAQLLLSNDTKVVEGSAEILRSLIEFNLQANSKLYLTGAFFFGCRYTGNSFLPLANLFAASHLKQSFHDSASSVARDQPIGIRSVLGAILPAAVINMLANYGPERFATVFTGDFDTPEVIWNAELRKHTVEMIDIHIGNLSVKLRQYTLARYEYCPIAKIHYANLEKEIYVHEYYLKNLCDEVRFPEWPIGEPLILLRECIEKWREEMSKGVVDTSVGEAKKLLGLKEKFDNFELRKAYKNMARVYHPDKNPNGRDMFEKIFQAYELLSSVELQVNETDNANVVLLMKTQVIVYRRFASSVADQKYPAYPLLINVLNSVSLATASFGSSELDIIVSGVMLMYYTCSVSPLNVREFVKAGAVSKLHELSTYGLQAIESADSALKNVAAEILVYVYKTFTVVSMHELGREKMVERCPQLAEDMFNVLCLDKKVPLAVENCLETISRGSSNSELQQSFISAGVVWRIIPMLLGYDGTLQDDYSDETQRKQANQVSSNMHAILAAKALGRLGGYMFDELASPENLPLKKSLDKLLTQPLAKLLRNRRPWEFLGALNENVEKATKIWNISMRTELLSFVAAVANDRPKGSNDNEMESATSTFSFSALKDELCVGGVYIRIFNKTSDSLDIENPSNFCKSLIDYIWLFTDPSVPPATRKSIVRIDFQEQTCEALSILAGKNDYIADDIAATPHGLDTIFLLLERRPEEASFKNTAKLMNTLSTLPKFISSVVEHEPPCFWRLLRAACVVTSEALPDLWAALEGYSTNPDAVELMIDIGAIARLLGLIFGIEGYVSTFQNRLFAISLLSKLLWSPSKGPDAAVMLRRFLPEPVVLLLRSKAGNASLQVLDTAVETPEMIWTKTMQNELREAIDLHLGSSKSDGHAAGFDKIIEVAPDYSVNYAQLTHEIFVGNVYIRLYLKQPTFRLSDPIFFLEKLVEFWESSFVLQVPESREEDIANSSDSRAVILGNEDFISLLTSCLICVVKGEPSVVDQLLTWEFPGSLVKLLKRSLNSGRRGTPVMAVVRLLHQLVSRYEVVDFLAKCGEDVVLQLTRVLDINEVRLIEAGSGSDGFETYTLPRDAAFIVELLKKIFQTNHCQYLGYFGSMALNAKLPYFVLDFIIGANPTVLAAVKNPSALRIHSVDLIKAIIAGDPNNGQSLQAILDLHPAWAEFKDQNHDLFITDQEKTDYFLIEDSAGAKFVGLLTDGKVSNEISKFFTSTGPPSVHSDSILPTSSSSTPRSSAKNRATVGSSFSRPSESAYPNVRPSLSSSVAQPDISSTITKSSNPAPSLTTASLPSTALVPAANNVAATVTKRQSLTPPSTLEDAKKMTDKSKKIVKTVILKSEYGIGLDLVKTTDGGVAVQRLKEMPDGSPNPASVCNPPVLIGDVIVGVNDQRCTQFVDVVKGIRGCNVRVSLWLERVND